MKNIIIATLLIIASSCTTPQVDNYNYSQDSKAECGTVISWETVGNYECYIFVKMNNGSVYKFKCANPDEWRKYYEGSKQICDYTGLTKVQQ